VTLEAALEALLFAADRPLGMDTLRAALPDPAPSEESVSAAISLLEHRFSGPGRGVHLVRSGTAWQFRSAPATAPLLRRFLGESPQRLSRPALETLAIVAWRQPVTRAEVERVRGVDSGPVLRALIERGMLRVAGRKDEPGRPIAYGTTPAFLRAFGMQSLSDLPPLREFTELGEEEVAAVADADSRQELKRQVTFDEYAVRRAIDEVDRRVDARLRDEIAAQPPGDGGDDAGPK
jgi:segregation and condensation protein B